jgi:ligand-binding sensor protein
MEKNYSEEATRLLETLQSLQDDFAEIMGAIIVTTDRNGDLVTKMSGLPKPCQIIRETEKGLEACNKDYYNAVSLSGKHRDLALIKCHAGFVALYIPIFLKGELVGSITGCGGRFSGESDEEMGRVYRNLAGELGIIDAEGFVEVVKTDSKVASEEEIKRRISIISTAIETLIEETPLKEVFTT